MSGFNLSQRAWGKVMIQMLSPSSASIQFSTRGRETEGWTEWEESPGAPTCLSHIHACTSLYIMSMPVQQSCALYVGKGEGMAGMTRDSYGWLTGFTYPPWLWCDWTSPRAKPVHEIDTLCSDSMQCLQMSLQTGMHQYGCESVAMMGPSVPFSSVFVIDFIKLLVHNILASCNK